MSKPRLDSVDNSTVRQSWSVPLPAVALDDSRALGWNLWLGHTTSETTQRMWVHPFSSGLVLQSQDG
jgi:hypothetical protein